MMALPEGWKKIKLSAVITDMGDGGTPSRSNSFFFGGEIPWVVIEDIRPLISRTINTLTPEGYKACTAKMWPANSLILSTGATIGEIGINAVPLCTKQGIVGITVNRDKAKTEYLYFFFQWKKGYIRSLAQGSTIKEIRPPTLRKLPLILPPLKEQTYIAEILGSVDAAIAATRDVIAQTARLKKALMTELLTRGLPSRHTRFKPSLLGQIPENWEVVKLGNVFELVERRVKMSDDEEYRLVTVKRRNGGIVPRETLLGKQIKVKTQYKIKTGDFLISKRQIVHGACEIVPEEMDGAVVSNEYHTLKAKQNLHLPYFRWLSRLPFVYRYFLISSVGVHIEKMLFKLPQWLKLTIALPPLEEQIEITDILTSVEDSERQNRVKLEQLQKLKTALMQVLLTGRVRVPAANKPQTSKPQKLGKEAANG